MNLRETRDFVYNELKFCGCGSPETALQYLVDALRALRERTESDWSDPSKEAVEKFFPDYGCEAPNVFLLYILDDAELIEHGGSIGGSWLTERGNEFLKAVAEHGVEKILSPAWED